MDHVLISSVSLGPRYPHTNPIQFSEQRDGECLDQLNLQSHSLPNETTFWETDKFIYRHLQLTNIIVVHNTVGRSKGPARHYYAVAAIAESPPPEFPALPLQHTAVAQHPRHFTQLKSAQNCTLRNHKRGGFEWWLPFRASGGYFAEENMCEKDHRTVNVIVEKVKPNDRGPAKVVQTRLVGVPGISTPCKKWHKKTDQGPYDYICHVGPKLT
ncbi:hypothetical protein B0H13DRAFT_1863052 [Mycena leptocephala]|nr:hypothetical protein B0H13DRAFT_1863052 [Mycena leptocephala]